METMRFPQLRKMLENFPKHMRVVVPVDFCGACCYFAVTPKEALVHLNLSARTPEDYRVAAKLMDGGRTLCLGLSPLGSGPLPPLF